MLRRRWAVRLLIIQIFLLGWTGSTSAAQEEFHWTLGLRAQYPTLNRRLKIGDGGRRIETPSSDASFLYGVVLNVSRGSWFAGSSYSTGTFSDSEGPLTGGPNPKFRSGIDLDWSEFDLAIGYRIKPWVGPYIGYYRLDQGTTDICSSCIRRVTISSVGPGLLINHPLPNTRWAAYLKTALIQGFSIDGGISYAGIRRPVVGVLGYSYRRIDYPADEASCGQPGDRCVRDRDVLAGPVVMIHYVY